MVGAQVIYAAINQTCQRGHQLLNVRVVCCNGEGGILRRNAFFLQQTVDPAQSPWRADVICHKPSLLLMLHVKFSRK